MIYSDDVIKKKLNKKEKIKKAEKIIKIPFIVVFIILLSYIGYLKFIKHETNINLFGYRQYIVETGSMEPQFNIGDLIVTKKVNKEDIKVNDVITYIAENGKDTITHRVTQIIEQDGQTFYRTKGDNNNSEDSNLINYSQVQGTIMFKISKAGLIITSLLTGNGIIIICVLVFISYLRSSRKEEKRIAREDARRLYNIAKYEKEEVL